jgi:hypothetical protein
MNDFKNNNGKNYNNNNTNKKSSGKTNQSSAKNGNSPDNMGQTINNAANIAKAFAGKSNGQIMNAILAQAEEGKRNGTLTNADLDNFYNTVAPLIDNTKRKKLAQIIKRLKEI